MDIASCIAQIKRGFIKGDQTIHISPSSIIIMNSKGTMKLTFNITSCVIINQTYS